MIIEFQAGQPACPVECKYCFITEHDQRRALWNLDPEMGINRACTFVNIPPWITDDLSSQQRFQKFPWEILLGDFVGFTAITDPFWPKLDPWLWTFLENASQHAKLVTCVTKWPLTRATMRRLARIDGFMLVVSITGNAPPIEKIPVKRHLNTLQLAKEENVAALPICHPYIAGVSDLSFLPELVNMGYSEIDIKGFRYCSAQMASWMPPISRLWYANREDEEVLPDDGWRTHIENAGMSLLSPRRWYIREGMCRDPHLSLETATSLVDTTLTRAKIVSSNASNVRDAAIARRL